MAKVWSFNTTVRNPERMQNFLRALKELEGEIFNEETQERFFFLQIKKRLYKPTKRTLKDEILMNEVTKETAEEIPDEIVKRMIDLYREKEVNAEARGRTTAGILNRFGLCVAHKSKGAVIITEMGKNWLENKIDDQELFFKFLLKWQYPNPLESGYSNFNVKPFIGTLHLINAVNKKWEEYGERPVGISKKEFMLFVPSLTRFDNIDLYSDLIIEYRRGLRSRFERNRKNYEENFTNKRISDIFGPNKDLGKVLRDLRDYTDSAIRYFRMSGFIYLRGDGHYIDIAPDYSIQVNRLLEVDTAEAKEFKNYTVYFRYLTDVSLPDLPWENQVDLANIKGELTAVIQQNAVELSKSKMVEGELKFIETLPLVDQIVKLNEIKNDLQIEKLKRFKYNNEMLKKSIQGIENTLSDKTRTVTTRPSLDLEWFVSLSLMVLNDAQDIKPSYKLGDDGVPTGFSSDIADIECYYPSFGMIVEVTLLRGRDQWFSEGQPVMRHLRDYEDKNKGYKNIFCIFVAPHLHRDTLNTFWSSLKYGYEGKRQKVIPLTIEQFLRVLSIISEKITKGKNPKHPEYQKLFEMLLHMSEKASGPRQWVGTFDDVINKWR